MKNGKYAIYLGREYISGKAKDGKLVLRSTNRKDVEDYYRLKTKAKYAGYEFEVIEEKG